MKEKQSRVLTDVKNNIFESFKKLEDLDWNFDISSNIEFAKEIDSYSNSKASIELLRKAYELVDRI